MLKSRAAVGVVTFFLLVVLSVGLVRQIRPRPSGALNKAKLLETFGHLPLSFEVNRGQADATVKFISNAPGFRLALTSDAAVFESRDGNQHPAMRLKLPRGSQPVADARDALSGKVNYLIGNDPAKWLIDVPHYSRLRYRDFSPGVDLVFHGDQRSFEYDLEVAPGAEVASIALEFEGVTRMHLGVSGRLFMDTPGGEIRQNAPVIYQSVGGQRRLVRGEFALLGENRVGFKVEEYDRTRTLVIDPSLQLFTYLGGSGSDQVNGIAVDASGNLFMAGVTTSSNFPTRGAFQGTANGGADGFVTKMSQNGLTIVYSTYIGGSGDDQVNGIALAPDGTPWIAGVTVSTNFPLSTGIAPFQSANAGGSDCFFTHLNANGNGVTYSSYLGGSANDTCNGIAVDALGRVFLTGGTASTNFPTMSPFQATFQGGASDAFLSVFNPPTIQPVNGLIYSTYLGGPGADQGYSVAVNSTGNPIVTGGTTSVSFPITPGNIQPLNNGGSDVFITKFIVPGGLAFSTLLGGSGNDVGYSVAIGPNNTIYVAGSTASANFPTKSPQQLLYGGGGDCFLATIADSGPPLFNTSGTPPAFSSTFFGGSGNDSCSGVAVGPTGLAYLTGDTSSFNFPILNAYQGSNAGGQSDAFLTILGPAITNSTAAPLVSSTFFGGSGNDSGSALALLPSGGICIVGASQCSFGSGSGCGGGTINGFAACFNSVLGTAPCVYAPGTSLIASAPNITNATVVPIFSEPAGCPLSPSTTTPWIHLSTISGAISFTSDQNTGTTSRSGAISIGTQTITVQQAGSGCTYSWSPSALDFGPLPGTNIISVTTSPGCPWSVVPSGGVSASTTSGQGSGSIQIGVGAFSGSTSPLTQLLSVTGGSITINQIGVPAPNVGGFVGSAAAGTPVPGGATSLYGNFLGLQTVVATLLPLPTSLADSNTSLLITSPPSTKSGRNGKAAVGPIKVPLFFVSATQINFQMPWELLGATSASATVTAFGVTGPPVTLNLTAAAPTIYTINQSGSGQGAIQIANTVLFAAAAASIPGAQSRPAVKGVDYLTIYCTGLGDVTNRPASGAAASAVNLSTVVVTPTATVGGVNAPVSFAGLSPGFVGLYQVNLQVPAGAPSGNNVQVILNQGGTPSNTVTIAVQ